MFQKKVGLISAFCIAFGVHFLVANTFELTFPKPIVPTKPMFVFLGSFLRADDFTMSALDELNQKQGVYDQRLNLDIRSGSISRELAKPDLTNRIGSVSKYQYRPELNKGPEKVVDRTEDLGIDLAPFPTIRMRMDQRDQD